MAAGTTFNGRKGLGFYQLRHTFRTIADATKDFPAIRLIMGHVDSSIDDTYREEISSSQLAGAGPRAAVAIGEQERKQER